MTLTDLALLSNRIVSKLRTGIGGAIDVSPGDSEYDVAHVPMPIPMKASVEYRVLYMGYVEMAGNRW